MIIDSHAHLYGPRVTPRAWLQAFADYGSAISTRSSDYVGRKIAEGWFDETGDLLVADMDEAGIDKTVIMAIDFGLYAGTDDDVSLEQRYAIFYEAVQRHPQPACALRQRRPTASRRPGLRAARRRAVGNEGVQALVHGRKPPRQRLLPRIREVRGARASGRRAYRPGDHARADRAHAAGCTSISHPPTSQR